MSDTQITQNLKTRPTSTQVVRKQYHPPHLPSCCTDKIYIILMTKFQFNLLGKVKNQRQLPKSPKSGVTVAYVSQIKLV